MKTLSIAALLAATAWSASAEAQHGANPGHGAGAHAIGAAGAAAEAPEQAGQAIFGALSEIINDLRADPATDWERVNIAALRTHLLDMDALMTATHARMEPVEGGAVFFITGSPGGLAAAGRMVPPHIAMLNVEAGWDAVFIDGEGALRLRVTSAMPGDAAQIRGLGFYGVMALGEHHGPHHMMMATGRAGH